MKTRFASYLLLLFCFSGQLFAADDPALATVNGDPITSEMITRELVRKHSTTMTGMQRSGFDIELLLKKLINDQLLIQEARAIGLDAEPETAAISRAFLDKLAARSMLAELFPDTFSVTEEEIKQRFQRDYEEFEFRMLSVIDSSLAFDLLDSLHTGVPMTDLIERHSRDRFSGTEGLGARYSYMETPPVVKGSIPEQGLDSFIGPVDFGRVFSILKIEKRILPDPDRLDSVRQNVTAWIRYEKRLAAKDSFSVGLRGKIGFRVDSSLIEAMQVRIRNGEEPTDQPVAVVAGNHEVTERELRTNYLMKITSLRDGDLPLTLTDVLQRIIDEMMFKEAANRQGYARLDSNYVRAVAYEDSLLLFSYLNDVIQPTVKVDSQMIAEEYEKNPDLYRNSPLFRISTLTRETLEEARKDYEDLSAGAEFGWLARRNSIDDVRDKSGRRGWLEAAQFSTEIRAALDSLSPGQITPPFEIDPGYTIFLLEDRKQGEVRPLEDVAGYIRQKLESIEQAKAIDKTLTALRETSVIEINEDLLGRIQLTGTQTNE